MSLRGKGFMIVNLQDCEGGDTQGIADLAHAAGIKHITIKIADGPWRWNFLRSGQDLIPPLIKALHAKGISVWGWHFIYGRQPLIEANIAIRRIYELQNLDGYIINAESQFFGQEAAAKDFISQINNNIHDLPLALCSFRSPQLHTTFPWNDFLQSCQINMPQVFWLGSSNVGDMVRRSAAQFNQMDPNQSIVPVGSAYEESYTERGRKRWFKPTPADINDFLSAAVNLYLPAATFFSWDCCRAHLPDIWDAIAAFQWPGVAQPKDIRDRLLKALNTRDTSSLAKLYKPDALHITTEGPVYGIDQITKRYETLVQQKLPNATYRILHHQGNGEIVHFTWEADCSIAKIQDATDSLCLVDGKIVCHYSHFTVSA